MAEGAEFTGPVVLSPAVLDAHVHGGALGEEILKLLRTKAVLHQSVSSTAGDCQLERIFCEANGGDNVVCVTVSSFYTRSHRGHFG